MPMFIKKLTTRANTLNLRLCVGLDPDLNKIKAATGSDNVLSFNQKIIDATADYTLCYKPQIAHYSALGIEQQLEKTIAYIHTHYPDIPVILDAKRGDIGSTAKYYALETFERYKADATTVNPYLGYDSLAPFLAFPDKGVIVLAKTSNPSAALLQDIDVSGVPLYAYLAKKIVAHFQDSPQLLFVVGATDTTALRYMRSLFPDRWFLVPGIGAQGGSPDEVIKHGGTQLIASATRSIIYPQTAGNDYFAAVRKAAKTTQDAIQTALSTQ